jgi:hypothetical protein
VTPDQPPPLNIPLPDRIPDDGADELTADEAVDAALDYETQQRLWVKSLRTVLELRSHDSDPSDRVQLALDLMVIAVCERVSRICRSDVPPDQG